MKYSIYGVCAAALLAVSAPSMAEWVYLRTSTVREMMLYGQTNDRTATRTWFRVDYTKPKILHNGKTYTQEKALMEMNCSTNQYRLLALVSYNRKGQRVDRWSSYNSWGHIVPDTSGEAMKDFICHHIPK